MRYSGFLTVKRSSKHARLRTLVREFNSVGCQVRFDRKRKSLELEVPADLYSWVRAGGLGRLLNAYDDVVASFPHFHERRDDARRPRQLPAPQGR